MGLSRCPRYYDASSDPWPRSQPVGVGSRIRHGLRPFLAMAVTDEPDMAAIAKCTLGLYSLGRARVAQLVEH